MARITRHLSYTNVAATLALVLATSGGAMAATGAFTASNSIKACVGSSGVLKLQTAKKCTRGQKSVTWSQKGPAGLKGATGATGPSGIAALNGAPVPSATTAQTASNALSLGGTAAAEFTHRDCTSETGQIKGFMKLPETFKSHTFTNVPGYNCSGQPIEAMYVSAGTYIVKFIGNPGTVALATPVSDEAAFKTSASLRFLAAGEWEVVTFEEENLENESFNLLVP